MLKEKESKHKYLIYMYTQTYSYQNHICYSPLFAIGPAGLADIFNDLPVPHSISHLLSASTSAGGGSWPVGVTQPSFLKDLGH